MRKRDFNKWKSKPGGFDDLHITETYESHDDYGIPKLGIQKFNKLPDNINVVSYIHRGDRLPDNCLLHGYLYDEQLLSCWRNPTKIQQKLSKCWAGIEPDYSVIGDMPLSLQIFNVYRSRWVSRTWQYQNNIKVIPNINWTEKKESYSFCFCGVPQKQIISIRMFKPKKSDLPWIMRGFDAMIKALNPIHIIIYGYDIMGDNYNIKKTILKPDWVRDYK